MLTHERAKECFNYDPETGEIRWAAKVARKVVPGTIAGTITVYGYRQIRFQGRFYKAHRIAWLISTGRWPPDEIDHINGDRADNRLANLREATSAENKQNLAKRTDNKTGFTGVYFEKRVGLWEARVMKNGRSYGAGYYETREQAAAAYARKKREIHQFQPVARSA